VAAGLFFAYGHLAAALRPYDFVQAGMVIGPNKILLAGYGLALALGSWVLVRATQRTLNLHLRGLTISGAILILMTLIPAFRPHGGPGLISSDMRYDATAISAPEGERAPPVYLIILDAYAGEEVLRELYGFDNRHFLDGLRNRGFFVAEESRSNYPQSILSIPSMLNFSYIDDLFPAMDENSSSRQPLQQLIRDNLLFRTLAQAGYRSITFDASGWDALNIPDADLFFETPGVGLSPLENELLNTSLAGFVAQFLPERQTHARADFHRHRIDYALNRVEGLANQPGPYIAYAHIGCPHQPFVFDADGSALGQDSERFSTWFTGETIADPDSYRTGYVNQLRYMNQRMTQLIDQLMADSRPQPIIILLSDHGPAMHLHTESAARTNLEERFSNLTAVYFPDQDYEALYGALTPVNAIRIMLNSQFGASLDLLPDEQFYAPWDHPYRMVPVSLGQ
jgi:hypothetical protein